MAAITGSIAEAYYGVPLSIREQTYPFLDASLFKILQDFEKKYPGKIEP